MLVVLLQRRRRQSRMVLYRVLRGARIRQLPHLHILVNYVISQLGFFEAGGCHPLLARGGRVWRIKACLNEPFARVRSDHRLKLPRREGVYVASLRGY